MMFQISNLSLLALVILGALEQTYSFRSASFRRISLIYAVKNSASEISPVVAGTVTSKNADAPAIVTDYAQPKMGVCCDEDFCFPEPPATETGTDNFRGIPPENLLNVSVLTLFFFSCSILLGLTIRCLLTKNGLDIEWINPEDEVLTVIDPKAAAPQISCEIDTEDEDVDQS